jgi:hypothetical protein
MPAPGRPERLLAWLLRGTAIVMGSALLPAVMPMAWMDAVHRSLGMGPLPQGPVVEYMARTLSAFYAFHGGLLWIFAGDVRRYAPAIGYCFATGLLFGAALLVVDTQARLPARWALAEGPFVAGLSAAALVLLARVRREAASGGRTEAEATGPAAKSS